jgi:hypothetical protein
MACNNGWMNNRIEKRARPFLTPLAEGFPVTLFPEAVSAVVDWIVLKTIVSEHMHRDEDSTPRADCVAFKEHGTIPAYFRVHLAFNNDRAWGGTYYRHSANLRRSDQAATHLAPRSVQVVSFGIGALFANVVASSYIEPEEIFVHNDQGLFPAVFPVPRHELRWPPRRPLTPDELQRIAESLETVMKEDPRIKRGQPPKADG